MTASPVQLIGGKFQDPEGNLLVNGYLKMVLSQDGTVPGVGSICSGIEITIQLNSAGSVNVTPPQYVWGNDVILPVNNYYKVTGYTAAGQPAWGPNVQQVIGTGTFDVGTWIPNTVISWVGQVLGPPTPPLALEVNGTPNVDQALLNITGVGTVSVVDLGNGTLQITGTGGAAFGGNGAYFFGPGITDSALILGFTNWNQATLNLANGALTANQVTVYLFELLDPFTISKASLLATNNTGGVTATCGIYDKNGNKVLDAGSFVVLTGPGIQTNNVNGGTPVTLPAGIYFHAQAATTAGGGVTFVPGIQVSSAAATNVLPLFNKNATRIAIAANPLVAGVLPATLGALTPFAASSGNGDNIVCPMYE
jgi:hypothetical protein